MVLNGIDWELEYGKPINDMSDGEYKMAVLSKLSQITGSMKRYNETCDTVGKHTLYWRIVLFIASPVIVGTIGWIISRVLK
jgi:hypothetical protein